MNIIHEEEKIAIKAEAKAQKMLFVKTTDLDADAAKFVQEYGASMCKRFRERRVKRGQKLRSLAWIALLGLLVSMDL